MAYYAAPNPEADTNKEAWGRQIHLLNLLTAGQLLAVQGEINQNPYYLLQGCDIMLEVLGPMLKEKVPVDTAKPEGKTKEVRGIDTPTYHKYMVALAEARSLVKYSMTYKISNKNELLGRAYEIGRALKAELLQQASNLNLDFKDRKDPMLAYKT